jgi:Trp operon repressor
MRNFERPPQPQIDLNQGIPMIEIPEGEITPDQKEILESAIKFAEYLTDRWPQVDIVRKPVVKIDDKGTTVELPELPEGMETETRLNYYLCGSLATMLFSCAKSFTKIDETQLPALVEVCTREIPESARTILASFARQIGDLDYVPMNHYKKAEDPTRLGKGGGGPSFGEVPEAGRKVLRRGENQIKVMCDPVEAYGIRGVAKVNVGGRDYYIARPDTILAYKVLHLLQRYETEPEKFNTDFEKLLSALKEMYNEEELIQITRQILTHYEEAMEASHYRLVKLFFEGEENQRPYEKKIPNYIERVLANQQLSPDIQAMLESLREQK